MKSESDIDQNMGDLSSFSIDQYDEDICENSLIYMTENDEEKIE